MNLVMRSKDINLVVKVDSVEKQGDVVYAYKKAPGSITADEFVGMFDLGSMDFLYVTDERNVG